MFSKSLFKVVLQNIAWPHILENISQNFSEHKTEDTFQKLFPKRALVFQFWYSSQEKSKYINYIIFTSYP